MDDQAANEDEVGVTYDASDFRALYGVCSRCRRFLIIIALLPAMLGVSSYFDGYRGFDFVVQSTPYFFFAVVAPVGIYFLSPLVQIRSRRKNGWDCPISIRLTEHAVTTRHPSQNSQFPWSAIKKLVATADRLYFFTTPACALILPRRCFANDEQFHDWAARAHKYWDAAQSTAVTP